MNTTKQAKDLLVLFLKSWLTVRPCGELSNLKAKEAMRFFKADKELSDALNSGTDLSKFQLKTCDWNSVHDILPPFSHAEGLTDPDSITVDVVVHGERWPDCYYCYEKKEWCDSEMHIPVLNVTHWMEIPKLPELEK